MNTYTNTMQPKKEARQPVRNHQFRNLAIIGILLTLVVAATLAISTLTRPAAAENHPAIPYSNALEMQYARPWLEAQQKPLVQYGNTLELQYARPWLEAQNKSSVAYGNALEMQYAQPWLDKAKRAIVVTGNAQEQIPQNCSSSMEMLYACKYGFGLAGR